jgi:hypothetical protein
VSEFRGTQNLNFPFLCLVRLADLR